MTLSDNISFISGEKRVLARGLHNEQGRIPGITFRGRECKMTSALPWSRDLPIVQRSFPLSLQSSRGPLSMYAALLSVGIFTGLR